MDNWDDEEIASAASYRLPPIAWDIAKSQHLERLNPKHWLTAARNHKHSADVIWAHELPHLQAVNLLAAGRIERSSIERWPILGGAQLLWAYAFETLLKGIILAKYPEIRDLAKWGMTQDEDKAVRKEREKGPDWMTHNVEDLIALAAVDVQEPWARLLWILEGKAVWSGRYPAGVSVPKSIREDEAGIPDFVEWPDPLDIEMINDVFRYLEARLVEVLAA